MSADLHERAAAWRRAREKEVGWPLLRAMDDHHQAIANEWFDTALSAEFAAVHDEAVEEAAQCVEDHGHETAGWGFLQEHIRALRGKGA